MFCWKGDAVKAGFKGPVTQVLCGFGDPNTYGIPFFKTFSYP
jgi:hypothetical protein